MTQDRFLKLLDNPDLLASISYEELKTLALSYPYAHNLRYLLAIKSGQDKHPEYARNLASAAAYSLDRTRLFALTAPKKLAPQLVVVQEEKVLELKPIEAVQRELEAKAPLPRTAETPAAAPAAARVDYPEQIAAIPDLDLSEPFSFPDELVLEEKTPPVTPVVVPPEPKTPANASAVNFASWMGQFKPQPLRADGPNAPWKKEKNSPSGKKQPPEPGETTAPETTKANVAQQLAEKSVQENKGIVSETLARLYIRQGYREKAIDMFERLCLAFPEKSAYFAAEIDKLKK
ncbi:MAG: hypothetical protein IT262_21330 [Saprospiraceae bacterium]|nr:hypothetical protein [Saprospiraceae bacterium]